MSRKTVGALMAAAAAAAVAAVPAGAGEGAHAAGNHTVTLQGVRFHPGTLNVNRGDSVTWACPIPKSKTNAPFHTVHSRPGSTGPFPVPFSRAGTFAYICTV